MEPTDIGIGVLVGAALPLIIAVIQRANWSDRVRSIVAFVICLIAAAVTSLFTPGVDIRDPSFDWAAWLGIIYAAAMVSYARFWKPIQVAPTIERNVNGP